jgi:Flp pilus assembly protein TadB
MNQIPAVFAFLSVASIALFSFVAVAVWADARRKEREAFYRSEIAKKIAETHPPEASLAYLRLEEANRLRRMREGLKLGGVITLAAGAAVVILFLVLCSERGLWVIGLVPLLVGMALLAYVYVLGPAPPPD